MKKELLSKRVKKLASTSGFDLCGITSAEIIPEAKARYLHWIKEGYHADMKYLENWERRTDPRHVVADAKSVIMLALNYYSEELPEAQEGKIARYARGRDYHRLIEKMLKSLTRSLVEEFPDEQFRFYVDYGPFLERAYAEKAGLGFIGKNGMVITKQYGSWVFLAEVITSMQLALDEPAERRCGTCSKCMESCPTNAIIEPGLVDSNLCIPFHTIESKSATIPDTVRSRMDGWIFGCDICQEVCPFNNAVRNKETKHSDLKPRYTSLSNNDTALDSEEQFLQKFQGTPIMRTKRQGLRRNFGISD